MRTCEPEAEESLSGYMRRLSGLNAYSSVGEFYGRLGYQYGRPFVEDISNVAAALEIEAAKLEAIAPSHKPNESCKEWRFERGHSDPFCPECLSDGKPWQASWRHCYVTACASHGVRLIDKCPRCKTTIGPQTGGFRSCECGLPFTRAETDDATPEEILIAQLFEGLGGVVWKNDLPPDIGAFVHFLAGSGQNARTGKAGKMAYPTSVDDAVDLVCHAGSLLSNWPNSFDAELSRRLEQADASTKTAAEKLGSWYQRLMRFTGPSYEPFKERLLKVVASTHDGPYHGHSVDLEDCEWISATEAARRIGIRGERVVSSVASGSMEGRQYHSGIGHRHTQVKAEQVELVIVQRKNALTAKDAAKLLGVGKRHFRLLVDLGFVDEINREEQHPLVEGRFEKIVLDGSVERIRSKQRPINEGEGLVLFSDINLRRTTDRRALTAVLKAIRDGDLRPVTACKETLLGQYEFSALDIKAVLKGSGSVTGYTAKEVSELTGWKHECVTHWCRSGFLGSEKAKRGGAEAYSISAKDLVEFQKRYVVIADLAIQTQRTPQSVFRHLANSGAEIHVKEIDLKARRCGLVAVDCLLSPDTSRPAL